MKIGVKNFRVFKDHTDFELKPITILVGPNNSGKSSFTKLLLLLKSRYEFLNFGWKGDHNLESFQKCLNRDSDSKEITINFSINNDLLFDEERYGSVTYFEEGVIKLFSLFDNIISFEIDEDLKFNYDNNINSYNSSVNIQELIRFIIKNLEGVLVKKNKFENFDLFDKEDILMQYKKAIDIIVENESQFDHDKLSINTILFSEFYHRICEFEEPYLLFEVLIDGKNVTNDLKERIIEYQNSIFKKNMSFDLINSCWDVNTHLIKHFFRLDDVKEKVKRALIKDFEGIDKNKIVINNSKLADLMFNEGVYSYFDGPEIIREPIIVSICKSIFTDLNNIINIRYLPALRGKQQRVYHKSDFAFSLFKDTLKVKNPISFIIFDQKGFYKEIAEIFNLEGEIKIEEFEDVLSVYLVTDKMKENLADKGLGFSQLIPLILYNYMDFGRTTLIIEEPEANLHPALQSKLADFFVCINKFCPKVTLIIETHSEYLIRKLQFLVASKKVESEDCIIHYFNSNDRVTKNEPKVKSIEINNEGALSDHFGSGFFDEVSLLQIELMKYWKENQN